jgi:hypothetical protein
MKQVHIAPLRVLAMALLAPILLVVSPTVAAQEVDRPCGETVAPADEFQSQGIGLTLPELTALYGPHDVGQGSLFFELDELDGVQLHKVNCDLILVFPQVGTVEQLDEIALAESLLPVDAELVGNIALGTTIAEFEANTLWRSQSLADRFASMDENRGGEILIVYTYELMKPGIQRVELRTLELPE